jgi:hypothetical protein
MELKTARLTLLIDPNKKAAFERLCAEQDRTASQVVRQFIRDYLVEHGVQFAASGATQIAREPADDVASVRARPVSTRKAAAVGKSRSRGHKT